MFLDCSWILDKSQSGSAREASPEINYCCSRPGDVCVDVRLKQKRRRSKQNERSGQLEFAKVAGGTEVWVVIFEECLNSSLRWGEKTNVQSCEECWRSYGSVSSSNFEL